MVYKVAVFFKGQVLMRDKVEATSPLLAAKKAKRPMQWSHMAVAGKSIRRYNKNFKVVTDEPTVSELMFAGKYNSLLVMFGTLAEVYKFKTKKDAELAHEEVLRCIISTSAASVAVNRVLTGIIVFLDETRGSRSSSTSPKILSGSVTDVTWKEGPTLGVTARRSGIDKSEDTDTNTWYSGSKVFPSRLGQTLLATVKKLPDSFVWPGTNRSMKKMEGKTLEFKYKGTHSGKKYYIAKGFFWLEEWMDISRIVATVKELPTGTVGKLKTRILIPYDSAYAGKTLALDLCHCGCGCYRYDMTTYFMPQWLEPKATKVEATVKPDCPHLVDEMKKWAGSTLMFTKREDDVIYVYRGWYFGKDWLIFPRTENA